LAGQFWAETLTAASARRSGIARCMETSIGLRLILEARAS
jgi:hypothetical protein